MNGKETLSRIRLSSLLSKKKKKSYFHSDETLASKFHACLHFLILYVHASASAAKFAASIPAWKKEKENRKSAILVNQVKDILCQQEGGSITDKNKTMVYLWFESLIPIFSNLISFIRINVRPKKEKLYTVILSNQLYYLDCLLQHYGHPELWPSSGVAWHVW